MANHYFIAKDGFFSELPSFVTGHHEPRNFLVSSRNYLNVGDLVLIQTGNTDDSLSWCEIIHEFPPFSSLNEEFEYISGLLRTPGIHPVQKFISCESIKDEDYYDKLRDAILKREEDRIASAEKEGEAE